MQSLVHLTSTLSDIREFNKTQHGLIFANTLHHAYNRSSLWTLFWMKNFFRTILIIVALSITAHFHLTDVSAFGVTGIEHSKYSGRNLYNNIFVFWQKVSILQVQIKDLSQMKVWQFYII